MIPFKLNEFINKHIVDRDKSLFQKDIDNNYYNLKKEIKNKSVLVIGGAGTIGSSFIESLLRYEPRKLIVVDNNENALAELNRNLRSNINLNIPKNYILYPIDFNSKVFYKVLEINGSFDIIANFAAHKHVRSEKDILSIEAMFRNNIFSAKKFLDRLILNPPNHFFCVSTDKATNPVNLMGASKKIMEDLILSYSKNFKVTTARFANVAFSNGSLFHGYLNRLSNKQPISCPNDIDRYFVTREESGQICLLACILGKNKEIFFPRLAKNQIYNLKKITEDFFNYLNIRIKYCESEIEAKKLSKTLNEDDNILIHYPVYFFNTTTSGEKPFEEFYCKNDIVDNSKFEMLSIIDKSKNLSNKNIKEFIEKLELRFMDKSVSKSDIINVLNKYLVEFSHKETNKNLDQVM